MFLSLPQALKARGYERLVLQVGRGSVLPAADSCAHISLEAFRFKDSIAEDIKQADLVISHAGKQRKHWAPPISTLPTLSTTGVNEGYIFPVSVTLSCCFTSITRFYQFCCARTSIVCIPITSPEVEHDESKHRYVCSVQTLNIEVIQIQQRSSSRHTTYNTRASHRV